MPGFPALLALPRLVWGDRLLPARLWLAVVGTLACFGVWKLGAGTLDETTRRIAASLAGVSPVMGLFTPPILCETAFGCLLVVSLVAGERLLRRHRGPESESPRQRTAGLAACAGIAVAAATYIRPSWLLAGPLFAIGLVLLSRRRSRALRDGVIVVATLLLALLPWGLRNQRAVGKFVLTTLWMGPSLYDGLNPTATGESDMAFYDRDDLLSRGLSEVEVDRYYRDAAWEYARSHPARVLELAAIKLWRFWKPWPNADQFGHPLAVLAVALSFGPLLVLAVVGAWSSRRDPVLLLVTLGPILYFSVVHLVFVSSLRYRLPAEYPMLALSAAGLRAAAPSGWFVRRHSVRPAGEG
jgi:4-amino-4-deoxy-L-arabinose transferase-like glycosyltransferase